MPCIDFELQDTQAIYIMRNHFHLWQRIHIISNFTTDSFTYILYIIESFDDAIIIYAKEKGTTQAIGKSTYALQPTLRLFLFKHQLEIVRSTFCYQSL